MAAKKKSVTAITEGLCKNALCIIDRGLSDGLANGRGQVCIEYAIAIASGTPEDKDGPRCVHPNLRSFKISLNDDIPFTDEEHRARALRRIGIAQLGTDVGFDWKKFTVALSKWNEEWLAKFAKVNNELPTLSATDRKTVETALKTLTLDDLYAAWNILDGLIADADDAVDYSTYDTTGIYFFSNFADEYVVSEIDIDEYIEGIVQILKRLKTPGSKFLYLTEGKKKFKLDKAIAESLKKLEV